MAWIKFPEITTADRSGLTLLEREVVYDTDTQSLWYGDGATVGGIEIGTTVGFSTDLSIGTITGTTVDIDSSTGASATIPQATETDAGLMSAVDKTYIDNLDAYIIAMAAAL